MNFYVMTMTTILGFSFSAQAANRCEDAEKSYKILCTKKKEGSDVCLFKNNKDILKALDLIERLPEPLPEEVRASEKFYASVTPTQKDVEDEITRSHTCTTSLSYSIWQSVTESFDGNSKQIRKRSSEVIKKRMAVADLGNDLISVFLDQGILSMLVNRHMVSTSAPARQELEAMRFEQKEKQKEFLNQWATVLPGKPEDYTKETKIDPAPIAALMKKEHAYHVQQHQRLQQWVSTNLK